MFAAVIDEVAGHVNSLQADRFNTVPFAFDHGRINTADHGFRHMWDLVHVVVMQLHIRDQVLKLGAVLVAQKPNANLDGGEDVSHVHVPHHIIFW